MWCNDVYGDCPNSEDEADCGDPLSGYTERDGTHYKVFDQAMVYSDAQHACAVDGGHLAHETTQELHDFLVSLIQESGAGGDYWIGLQDVAHEGDSGLNTWAWSDGSPISDCFSNWAPGEPGNSAGNDCGQLWAGIGLKWDDTYCEIQKNFICQIGPDEENDCAPQGELCMEGQRQCLDGSCINEDYWCDGQLEDCTGGEDEANCEGDLSGYTERDGTNYKVFGQAMTYSDAQQACAVDGGHLADEKTQELHDFLVSLIQESGAGWDYWIGLQGVRIDNTWTWSDGTPISDCSFTNWAPGEPGNTPHSPVCGQLWTGVGFKWDDDFCHFHKNFICQIGPGEENACDPNAVCSERQCLDGSCISEAYWCDGSFADCTNGEDEADCGGHDGATTAETLTTVEENGGIIVTAPSGSLTTEGQPDQATAPGVLTTEGQADQATPPGGLITEGQPDQATPPGVLTTEGQPDQAKPPGVLPTEGQPDLATPPGVLTTAGQPDLATPPGGTTGIAALTTDDGKKTALIC
ncbi:macrophage mannose receptor 1-like [Branchiostoma lanceolatum]|uniref:macrophage mannose receptor 1-like n=1 Tax=Branchiostoma lanceolatum TaxID=7740 RepID=UPI003454EBD1